MLSLFHKNYALNIFFITNLCIILIMCDRQLLAPIFLTNLNKESLPGVKNSISALLKKLINWKHHDIYTPMKDQEEAHKFIAPLRWDWDGQRYGEDPKILDIKRSRYYWACETLNRLKILISVDGLNQLNILVPQTILDYITNLSLNAGMNVFQAFGFVHYFWCYHGNINFIGWHNPFMRLFEYWMRLADTINLLFSDQELANPAFKAVGPVAGCYIVQNNSTSIVTDEQKKLLRQLAASNLIDWGYGLPYWNWNYISKNKQGQYVTDYPQGMTEQINKINYSAFYFNPVDPLKGLDDTSSNDRYIQSMFGDFQGFYLDTSTPQQILMLQAVSFVNDRAKIQQGKFQITAFNTPQRFNEIAHQMAESSYFDPNLPYSASAVYIELQKINQTIVNTSQIDFWTVFHLGLENGPHNLIHNCSGYPMQNTPDAGFHPVFYLHHSNVQRNREMILAKIYSILKTEQKITAFKNQFIKGTSPNIYYLNETNQLANQVNIPNDIIKFYPFTNNKSQFVTSVSATFDTWISYSKKDLDYDTKIYEGEGVPLPQKVTDIHKKINQIKLHSNNSIKVNINRSKIKRSVVIEIYNVPVEDQTDFEAFIRSVSFQTRNNSIKIENIRYELVKIIPFFVGRTNSCENCQKIKPYTTSYEIGSSYSIKANKKYNLRYVIAQTYGNYIFRTLKEPKGIKITGHSLAQNKSKA